MEKDYTVTRWGDIDKTKDPENYFAYLDTVNNLEIIRQIEYTQLICFAS